MALRARIVLSCAKGDTNREVAQHLGVSQAMVGKWRRRFVERRLDGLSDDPARCPAHHHRRQVEAVIVKTLEQKPDDATHWSTRSMAAEVGMSRTTVRRIWRAFGLQPHRAETFKLSTDPLFVEKVRDIVGLYLDPPERAVVLCVDEKSQIQALNRFQPILPMMPGTPERRSHDYVRHGTTSLFAALDMATGKVIGSSPPAPPGHEFKKFLDPDRRGGPRRARRAPDPRQLRHPQDPRHQALAAAPPPVPSPLHPHSGSWLNMVERWFGELTTKKIKRGAHASVQDAREATSETGSRLGTRTPGPTSGSRPRTRSSPPWLATVSGCQRPRLTRRRPKWLCPESLARYTSLHITN